MELNKPLLADQFTDINANYDRKLSGLMAINHSQKCGQKDEPKRQRIRLYIECDVCVYVDQNAIRSE